MITELYRAYDWGTPDYMKVGVDFSVYPVIKETPHGYWIKFSNSKGQKWVNNYTKSYKFAYETKEQAMINFLARKRKQIRILKSQLSQAKAERRAISEMIIEAKVVVPKRLANDLVI